MEGYRHIKRLLSARLAILLLAALPCLSSAAQTLHFVTEPFPPFNYVEDGVVAGPTAKIVRTVCAQIKIECTFEILPWRRAILLTQQGKVDGIFSIVSTPERTRMFYLSTPFVETAYSLYAIDSNKFVYHNEQDLAGHKIGVYGPTGTSTTLEELVKPVHDVKIAMEIDTLNALRVLSSGGYGDDGLVWSNGDVADITIQKSGIRNLRKVSDVKKIQYSIGFSRQSVDPQLFKHFDDSLNGLIKDGTVKAILEKSNLKPTN
jgi:polar amino acid transport system substrate-binding protein